MSTIIENSTAAEAQLVTVVKQSGMDLESASGLLTTFTPFFQQAEDWRLKVARINVTDASQTREMKLARESRLALRELRVNADKARKRLKEESLRKGKAIDGMYNVIEYVIAPLEKALLDQEQFVERKEAERKAALKIAREAELAPLGVDVSFYQLGEMPDGQWNELLANTKIAYQAKQDAARKAEEERIAREKADVEERARIQAENERLKKEAQEREAALLAEREKAERERRALEAKAAQERKEREAAEAKIAEAKKREDEQAAAEASAKRKAENAPDREKLQALSSALRSYVLPCTQSKEATALIAQVRTTLDKIAQLIDVTIPTI